MKHIEEATLREWMDLDVDGALDAPQKAQLTERLRADSELADERGSLESLHQLLAESRIAVEPGFQARVMAALPHPAWRRSTADRGIPAWGAPLAAMLVFALGAAWLLAGSGLLTAGVVGGTAVALLDLASTSVLAGSGLLFATWQGLGWGLGEVLGDSILNLVAFGTLVVCLNLLLVSMLRRPQAVAVASDDDVS